MTMSAPYQRITVRRPSHEDRVIDDPVHVSSWTRTGEEHPRLEVLRSSGAVEVFEWPYRVTYGEERSAGCCGEPAPDRA